jgi:hypothetical protein
MEIEHKIILCGSIDLSEITVLISAILKIVFLKLLFFKIAKVFGKNVRNYIFIKYIFIM